MRAVVLDEFGPPSVLREAELPDPIAANEVDVEFASVTFVETHVSAGRAPNPAMLPSLPAVLGDGVGGVVSQVGADVDRSLLGRRVVTTTGGRRGYAAGCAVAAKALIGVPDELALDGVALLADGRTAIALADLAEAGPDDTVLVLAAAGGVGTLLAQLARGGGAVVKTAGGDRKVEVARSVGTDYLQATVPLARAADAHAMVESRGSIGKTLLVV
jgi:NADPH2:quinone reductase